MSEKLSMTYSIKKNISVLLLTGIFFLSGCVIPGQQEGKLPAFITEPSSWFAQDDSKSTTKATWATKEFDDGIRYEGEFKDGKRHGQGVQTWPDGARYDGEFNNDKREGHGRFTWPTKVQYEGDFANGKRHGHGVYTWPNGARYEGGYVDGLKNGPGLFVYPPNSEGQMLQEQQVWAMDKLVSSTPKEVVSPETNKSDSLRRNQPLAENKPDAVASASADSFKELPDRDASAYQTSPKPLVPQTENPKPKLWSDPESGITLAFIPGGCFPMGSTRGSTNEQPIHEVCLDPFWMGIHEITQKQWRQVLGQLPEQSVRSDDLPVGNVSWHDVEIFIQAINKRSGIQFRLPSEAQWEYACTGGGLDKDYCGNNMLKEIAWVEDNANNQPHPPGKLSPNRFGLYDMTGNLWEWVIDWYGADYYRSAPKNNPTGPTTGLSHVFRGGGWLSQGDAFFATMRYDMEPSRSYQLLGFRLSTLRVLGLP